MDNKLLVCKNTRCFHELNTFDYSNYSFLPDISNFGIVAQLYKAKTPYFVLSI